MTATLPRLPRQCSRAWLASTSSFCTVSPWTLLRPAVPRMSARPARRTWSAMILVARVMPDSSQENSPLASGWCRRCSSRMCCCAVIRGALDMAGSRCSRRWLRRGPQASVGSARLRPAAKLADAHAPALDAQPTLREQPDRLGVRLTLLLEHPRRQRLRRVVVVHRHRPLQDDRAVVVLVVGEVDGAAADLGAVGQHRLVDVVAVKALPAERG